MPRVKALDRDRAAHPNNRVYHPYVNDPSFCQRLFEIACLVLILASVPAWLGGVYSIFVTGYGTALGLIGLLSFGTRRHSCLFLVMSIIFFIFVIVVIILNAIDPIGKHLPFNDNTDYGAAFGAGGAINNGNNGNNNNNTTSAKRQTTDGTCQYNNCGFDLYKVGQLSDGQLRLMYGAGAGPVTFSLQNGVMSDNSGRKCYLSAQSQLQCDTIPQTNDYTKFCIDNGRLTYGGSPLWYQCKTGTGNDAANIYAGKLYGHCSSFMNLTCVNSTCGAGSEGIPTDIGSDPFANGGGVLQDGSNNNGTNSTDGNIIGGGGANNSTGFGAGGLYADRRFNGSRVYAYIDSGIILAATLLTIISALAILKEVRPAPGTLTHSSTTTTTSAPAAFGNTGTAGYGVPAAAATGAAVPSAFGAHGASNVGTTGHY